jgi:hypothetical protein
MSSDEAESLKAFSLVSVFPARILSLESPSVSGHRMNYR